MDYVSLVNKKIMESQNVVSYISDRRAEIILSVCIQFGVKLKAMCEDNKMPLRIGLKDADMVPVITEDELASIKNPDIIVSNEKYAELKKDNKLSKEASYYIYDVSLGSCNIPPEESFFVLNKRLEEKPVVLYGCGILGKFMLEWLQGMGVNPMFCCDSDLSQSGKKFCGVLIISPDELKKHAGKVSVIVTPLTWLSILPNLTAMGFAYNDVFLNVDAVANRSSSVLRFSLHKRNKDILEDSLYRIIEKYRTGKKLVEILNKNTDTQYFITGAAIGDNGLMAAQMRSVKKRDGYKRVCLISMYRMHAIAKLFPSVDETVGLGEHEYWALFYYFIISRNFDRNNVHFAFLRENWFIEKEFSDYLSRLKKPWFVCLRDVLSLPFDSEPEFVSDKHVDISHVLENMEPLNSVLLISQSASEKQALSKKDVERNVLFFKTLADKLKDKGIKVYSNCPAGFKIPPSEYVEGTEVLSTSPTEVIRLSRELRGVISVRSGLQEMLCLTDCNLSIIYERPYNYEMYNCDDLIKRNKMYSYKLYEEDLENIVENIIKTLE